MKHVGEFFEKPTASEAPSRIMRGPHGQPPSHAVWMEAWEADPRGQTRAQAEADCYAAWQAYWREQAGVNQQRVDRLNGRG